MASWNECEFDGWKSYLDDPCPYCDRPHFWQDCRYAPRREMCAPSPSYWEYDCSLCGGQDGHWSDFPNAPPIFMLIKLLVPLMSLIGPMMRIRKINIPGSLVLRKCFKLFWIR